MFVARVFSQKYSSTYVGNDCICSVGEDIVEQIGQNSKTYYFASISQESLTRETFAKTSCLHPVLSLRILVMCKVHASLHGKLTHEIPAKTALVFKYLSLQTLSLSHTTLTNKSHNKYKVHKIEHNYN